MKSLPTPASYAALLLAAATMAAVLWAMGRPMLCSCGTLALWGPVGPTQSQMLADWYSFSHVVHGFLFYAIGWALLRHRVAAGPRFALALLVEAAWEIAENSPAIIDRYREATIALGYSGDSILNSVSDLAMMALGYGLARRLPLPASLALVAALELLPLLVIRDNLALNILMLVAPSKTILAWQAGA